MKTKKRQMARISLAALCAALMVLTAASALAAPNISGRWVANNGHVYNIMQLGDVFTWNMPDGGQTGVGDIDDTSISAVWPFGYAEGTITVNSSGYATEIAWNNGVIFTRDGSGSGSGSPGGPGGPGDPGGAPAPSWTWDNIGNSASELYAGGNALFGVHASSGDIYRYDGSPNSWTRVGGPGSTFAVDDEGVLYGISPDGSGVWWFSGHPNEWTQIGGPASELFAGGGTLFATSPSGAIMQYNGRVDDWTRIGSAGRDFAVDGNGVIYAIGMDNNVHRYNGTPNDWTRIGGPATDLFAGGSSLYGIQPDTGDIYRYNGSPMDWTRVGGSGNDFAVDGFGALYGLSPTGVFRYDGTPENWTQIGGPGTMIEAGRNSLYGLTGDGNVWYYAP